MASYDIRILHNFEKFSSYNWGTNGFEELRRYIKQANELCKELSAILSERCELEASYAKSLSKISAKLNKVASSCIGTVAAAWCDVAKSMDEEADIHKNYASSMLEEVHKPMKNLSDSFHKGRKPIESTVEKAIKVLLERRADEARKKKESYTLTKEAEKSWDTLTDVKLKKSGAGEAPKNGILRRQKSDVQQEKKCRSLTDSANKADKEYYESSLKAEVSRLEWEAAIYKGSAQLQMLEIDRLKQVHEMLKKYQVQISTIGPAVSRLADRLADNLCAVDVKADVETVVSQRGIGPNQPEQLLFESYAEDFKNQMARHRREHALRCYSSFMAADVERELRSKEGIEKLVSVYHDQPSFADNETQEEARHKLISANAMLNYLSVSQYKVSVALATLNDQVKPQHPYSSYLERSCDKLGLPQTVLRIPLSLAAGDLSSFCDVPGSTNKTFVSVAARGVADGNIVSSDEEQFEEPDTLSITRARSLTQPPSNHSSFNAKSNGARRKAPSVPTFQRANTLNEGHRDYHYESSSSSSNQLQRPMSLHVIGWCRAIYDYAAQQEDELSIRTGDVISIYCKQEDGWWHGEKSGLTGIFPGSYAEEF